MAKTLELEIVELASAGDGVARDPDGRVTFVAGAAPGDRVVAELLVEKKDFARAAVREVLDASEWRTEPRCPHFASQRCGGCQWQHVSVDAQRRAKESFVAKALRRHVAAGLQLDPLVAPVPDYHWRRRARLHWYRAPSAPRAEIGFFAPRSQFVHDIEECVQLTSELARGLAAVRHHLAASLYGRGQLRLVAGDDGRAHVVIDGAARPGAAEALAGDPAIAGVRVGHRTYGAETMVLEGVVVSGDSFAQASTEGNEALVALVEEATASWRDGASILELYAGGGNLTRALTGARVLAVDRVAPTNSDDAVEWRVGDSDEVLTMLLDEGRTFDGVVLDPPRQGARAAVERLSGLRPRHIVYVSCDPATLGRDVGILAEAGFNPVRATPIDLMPQTVHVEVVVSLRRVD